MAKDKNKNPDDARSWSDWPESDRFSRRGDVACEDLPSFKAKGNQNWGLQDDEAGSDNLPGNELNNPVPLRTEDPPANGWLEIASDIEGTSGKGTGKKGNEVR
jgi:hypothetical protein